LIEEIENELLYWVAHRFEREKLESRLLAFLEEIPHGLVFLIDLCMFLWVDLGFRAIFERDEEVDLESSGVAVHVVLIAGDGDSHLEAVNRVDRHDISQPSRGESLVIRDVRFDL
jgi:mannitol/fructose-specific phosphotransferase system IIA component